MPPPPTQYRKLLEIKEGHLGGVTAIAFSPLGNYIATAGCDSKVCIWKVAGDQPLHTLSGRSRTLSLAWVPHREDTLLCGMQDGTVSTLAFTPVTLALPGHNAPVECLAISRLSTHMASGAHNELFLWSNLYNVDERWTPELDLGTPSQTSETQDKEILVTGIYWANTHSCASTLLVTYLHHGVVIFDSATWKCLRGIPTNGLIAHASVSTDSRHLVVSNLSSAFDVYAMEDGASKGAVRNAAGESIRAVPVVFAHGDKWIVGGSTIGTVHVWDATTLRLMQQLSVGGTRPSMSLIFLSGSRLRRRRGPRTLGKISLD
ncbi:WD40-repeat-containing domain protein [Trametes meyenii]|nr:WD40-repeat-containing domain protein [Trametes meyenii]